MFTRRTFGVPRNAAIYARQVFELYGITPYCSIVCLQRALTVWIENMNAISSFICGNVANRSVCVRIHNKRDCIIIWAYLLLFVIVIQNITNIGSDFISKLFMRFLNMVKKNSIEVKYFIYFHIRGDNIIFLQKFKNVFFSLWWRN